MKIELKGTILQRSLLLLQAEIILSAEIHPEKKG
jgi:hypothetical protein